jgi:hypothetical protein
MQFSRCALVLAAVLATPALAQQDSAELAKKLSNPVAALISVPFQLNYDHDIGPADDGEKWLLNVQPVVYQDDIAPGAGSQTGIGDVVQSLFFSPKAPTSGGWTYGMLANHIWSFAGDDDRSDVNAFASKVTRVGAQLVSLGGGLRHWADSPDNGPEGLGVRFIVTLLFPK